MSAIRPLSLNILIVRLSVGILLVIARVLLFSSAKLEQVLAMFPYTAQKEDELTFYKGSVINVVSKDGEWWKGEMNGQTGMFPSNYVQPLSNLQMGTTQCKYMSSTLPQLVRGVTSTSGLRRKLKSWRYFFRCC